MNLLKSKGVGVAFHYQSLATSPAGKRFGRTDGTPISNSTADTLVRLPLFASITDLEIDRVIAAVKEWSL
jgi:dTDP-4-amino-4,6-dideoxygalactose transaminase